MKRGKAPGPGGIMNELWCTYGGAGIGQVLVVSLNVVVKSECCPSDWKKSSESWMATWSWQGIAAELH